jgi:hypothetical protein
MLSKRVRTTSRRKPKEAREEKKTKKKKKKKKNSDFQSNFLKHGATTFLVHIFHIGSTSYTGG